MLNMTGHINDMIHAAILKTDVASVCLFVMFRLKQHQTAHSNHENQSEKHFDRVPASYLKKRCTFSPSLSFYFHLNALRSGHMCGDAVQIILSHFQFNLCAIQNFFFIFIFVLTLQKVVLLSFSVALPTWLVPACIVCVCDGIFKLIFIPSQICIDKVLRMFSGFDSVHNAIVDLSFGSPDKFK